MLNNRPDPLLRNQGALDAGEQQQLIRSAVAVCGCGGLGGMVIENLARIGVGRLRIVDPDSFTVSNLNRQLGATLTTLGDNKAEVMARRIRSINESCRIEPVSHDFRKGAVLTEMDVAVDCLDNSGARL
ncbi:MAG TPA: HesA/MoeB/ThiF family protein, partial [Desulfobulbaceae bacterium]|nr:HesA/MoeB/ThiF family protein [Desulfobulbaceae bacterium]